MFQRIVVLRDVVALYSSKKTGKSFTFTADEWDLAESVVEVLKPAYLVTKEISFEKYVTGSKVIPLVKGLFGSYHKKEAQYCDITQPQDTFKARE